MKDSDPNGFWVPRTNLNFFSIKSTENVVFFYHPVYQWYNFDKMPHSSPIRAQVMGNLLWAQILVYVSHLLHYNFSVKSFEIRLCYKYEPLNVNSYKPGK